MHRCECRSDWREQVVGSNTAPTVAIPCAHNPCDRISSQANDLAAMYSTTIGMGTPPVSRNGVFLAGSSFPWYRFLGLSMITHLHSHPNGHDLPIVLSQTIRFLLPNQCNALSR